MTIEWTNGKIVVERGGPRVSVVVPVYNAERFIGLTIESVLTQSLDDFELILINDASTDSSMAVLKQWAGRDARIRVLNHGKLGFCEALNMGCSVARGTFIARLDADDVCLPERFERQVAFLENAPEVDLCGSWVEIFDGASGVIKYPASAEEMWCSLLFYCPICHPSIMFRRSAWEGKELRYNAAYGEAADYGLWVNWGAVGQLVNVPEVLLRYRVHAGQITQADRPRQRRYAKEIRRAFLEKFGLTPTQPELDIHDALGNWEFTADRDTIDLAEQWLLKIEAHNRKNAFFDQLTLRRILLNEFKALCFRNSNHGLWSFRKLARSPLADTFPLSPSQKLRFLVKCGLHWKR